jgi:hypothetical protein
VYQYFKTTKNKLKNINSFEDLIFNYIRDDVISKIENENYDEHNFETPLKIYSYFRYIKNHKKIEQNYYNEIFKNIVAYLFYLFIEKNQKLKKKNGDFFSVLGNFINYYSKTNMSTDTFKDSGGIVINCLFMLNVFNDNYKYTENRKKNGKIITDRDTHLYLNSEIDKYADINKYDSKSKLLIIYNELERIKPKSIDSIIQIVEQQNYTLVAAELIYLYHSHSVAGLICKGHKVILDSNNYINFHDWTKRDEEVGYFYPELLFFIKKDTDMNSI